MESTFDQQASVLFDTLNRTKTSIPLKSGLSLDPSTSTFIDPIINRINSIEERLNASDSIYKLATQANAAKDKERRQQIQNVAQYAEQLNQRLDKIEERLNALPILVTNIVSEEIKKCDKTEDLRNSIFHLKEKYAERYKQLEAMLLESSKRNTKTIKKLNSQLQLVQTIPHDDSAVEEIQAQIDEMKRYQANVMSIMRAALQQNEGELGQIASQLNTVWSQISKH